MKNYNFLLFTLLFISTNILIAQRTFVLHGVNVPYQNQENFESQEIEYNSHILIKKDKLRVECNDLINHEIFMLVDIKECYPGEL